MTSNSKSTESNVEKAPESIPLFKESETRHVRVRPADLARLLSVSKQSVSQWIKNGKITLGSDGRVDPSVAVEQLLRNADPARLRAHMLRPLTNDVHKQQEKISELETSLSKCQSDLAELERDYYWFDNVYDRFQLLIVDAEDDLRLTLDSKEFSTLIRTLAEQAMRETPNLSE